MNNIINYAKGMNANDSILKWIELRVTQDKDQQEVEHIIDYLCSDKAPARLDKATYEQMKSNTDKWVSAMNKKGENIKELPEDTETILDFKDGFKIVKLVGENAYKREGFLMRHCVASYFGKDDTIYSLRDKDNQPHATMSQSSQQIKGKGNGKIHPKYINYVVKFLEYLKIEVRDSEMLNLGYINVEKYKKYLHKDIVDNLFNKKYCYNETKLKDKTGNDWACLQLLDQIPMFDDITTETLLKFNIDLPIFLKLSLDFLSNTCKTKKLISSGNYAQIGSSGNYAQIGSSGNSAQIGSSGNYAQIGSSGNYAQIGSSGYSAKIGSSGNCAKIGSSGYSAKIGSSENSAQIGSSGYSAKIGSSGNYAQIGSSGNSAKIGSSGYSAQIGSSGNSAKIGSSGNYAKIGSSGYSAQIEVLGTNSVCASIGINSKIKAKLGTWITLAEYDVGNKPVCVKSAQIDGIILKENIWYTLKNKEFVEAKED
jgi:hypothetical protein